MDHGDEVRKKEGGREEEQRIEPAEAGAKPEERIGKPGCRQLKLN
jgi:hypothetical protein